MRRLLLALALALGLVSVVAVPVRAEPPAAAAAPHLVVQFDRGLGAVRGRVLVFLTKIVPGKPSAVRGPLEPGAFEPAAVEILGTEVDAPAGAAVEIPVNADAYPAPLRSVPSGRYLARAELDVQHRYTYDGGQPGDPTSANVAVRVEPGVVTTIAVGARRSDESPRPADAAAAGGRMEQFVSPSMSAFFGRPVTLHAYVEPPPGYAASTRRFATVFVIGGFGASERYLHYSAAARTAMLARSGGTQLIYVHLDPHVPLGHGVFADSVNNGPLGHALTAEFIPYLESRWRMIGTERTRFLTGHSSGG